MYTSATNDSYPSCAFPLFDRSRTIAWVPHLALPVSLVSMALVLLLPSSLQILDSSLCCGPRLWILCTTLPRAPSATTPYPSSNSASPGIDSIVAHGFVGLPTLDRVSVFHATSSPFPTLLPKLKASVVTTSFSSVVSKTPQTTSGVVHLLA